MNPIARRHFLAISGLLGASAMAEEKPMSPKEYPTVLLPDGSRAPALGMGSWRLAAGRRPLAQEEEALKTGLALGMRLIDTAEYYSAGASEKLVGRAMAAQRGQVFVVTKITPGNARSEKSIRTSFLRSLERLGTDYLDLYLLHWRGGENLKATVAMFEKLRAEGQLRHWGVSNFGVRDMEELRRIPGGEHCATNQVRYSLQDRSMEVNGMIDWAGKHNMPLMAYSPLGSGGALLRHPALAELAKKHQTGPAAIAIAWTLRHGAFISIPESGNPAHIRENASAARIALDAQDLQALDAAFPARQTGHWSGT